MGEASLGVASACEASASIDSAGVASSKGSTLRKDGFKLEGG